MTKVIKKWQLNNKDKDKTFGSIEEFFNHSTSIKVDTNLINAHIENDDSFCTGKLGFLNDDKKHVDIIREFGSADMYDQWVAKRKELGDIDDLIEETEVKVESNEAYEFDLTDTRGSGTNFSTAADA